MSLLRAFKQRYPNLCILLPYMLIGLIAGGWLFKTLLQDGATLLFAAGWSFFGGVFVFLMAAVVIGISLTMFDL